MKLRFNKSKHYSGKMTVINKFESSHQLPVFVKVIPVSEKFFPIPAPAVFAVSLYNSIFKDEYTTF